MNYYTLRLLLKTKNNMNIFLLVVGHVSGCSTEFCIRLDDFVYGFQEVFLCCNFSTCSDGKHACLRADAADFSTFEREGHIDVTLQEGSLSQLRSKKHTSHRICLTCAVRTQSSQQLKPDVSFHTHRTSMDLKYVSSALKEKI